MRSFEPGKTAFICLLIVAAVVFMAAGADAQDGTAVAGKMGVKVVQNDSVVVNTAQGHVMYLGKGDGINKSTGTAGFMDNARVENINFSDLIMGNGPDQGYLTMVLGADTVYDSWNGKVAVRETTEGKNVITVSGTFTWTGGTGQYAGISGTGTYKGVIMSPDQYVVEWNGIYTLPK